jgi:large subunit ribosomal protein L7/L12
MTSRICGSFRPIVSLSRNFSISSTRCTAAPQAEDAERNISAKVATLVDSIASLTLQEVADLNTALKKRLNISEVAYSAAPAVAAAPVVAAPAEEEAVEEVEEVKAQTEFTLIMTGYDESKKVKVIKAIKANMPDMNLVASKKFIEALPKEIRKNVPKEEVDSVKAALEAEGAILNVK